MIGIVASLCRCGFNPEYDLTPVRKTVDGLVFAPSNDSQRSDNTGLPVLNATTQHYYAFVSQTPKILGFWRRALGLIGSSRRSLRTVVRPECKTAGSYRKHAPAEAEGVSSHRAVLERLVRVYGEDERPARRE
jgi:hypothetical protein